LYEEDASDIVETAYRTKDGRYATGLDVFHQLHCLVCPPSAKFPHGNTLLTRLLQNSIREALDVDYYEPDLPKEDVELYRMHVGAYPS
jgi:hypothetical protein